MQVKEVLCNRFLKLKKHDIKAYLAAFSAAVAVIVVAGIVFDSENRRFQEQERAGVLNQLSTIRAKLEATINSQLLLAEVLAAYTSTNPAITQAEFSQIARVIREKNKGIRSLNLAKNSVISHIYPLVGNEKAIGLNLAATPKQKEAVERTIHEKRALIAGPVHLVQGGVAFINRTPIFIPSSDRQTAKETYWGQASVLVEADAVYKAGGLLEMSEQLNLALRGKDGLGAKGEVFFGEAAVFPQNPVLLSVTIPNGSWQLAAVPKLGWKSTSELAMWIWLVSGAIAILSAGLMFTLVSEPNRLRIAVNQATAELQIALTQLQHEMSERQRIDEERQKAEVALRQSQIQLARTQTELDITRRLQQMLLPGEEELQAIKGLDIAGFMQPADNIGGDYYDIFQHNGSLKIGIGDVTGHGLESGVLMIMVQTAVRTILAVGEQEPSKILNAINQVIYQNVQRIGSHKNLTLALLDYQDELLTVSGQHEEVLVIRATGKVERLDTIDLGFPLGMIADVADFFASAQIRLNSGDGIVLYTDGITEAEGPKHQLYGLERLIAIVQLTWQQSAKEITQAVLKDVQFHVGEQQLDDDITLVVLKHN